ncbi:hypothetical protein [Aliikangiella maris]|uniref:Oxidoreductase n=2 Tax=Aliikangiella maris TaxID=3162458 RepID=A0ABV3MU10_9GAMM
MDNKQLFKNLKALEDASFPKYCSKCKTEFANEQDYIQNTIPCTATSGLSASTDDKGRAFVKLKRQCRCGQPILDHFSDRRDVSRQGELRRQAFEKVIQSLLKKGLSREQARKELLNYMNHKKSSILEKMGIFNR